jgi:drug/metabolite transporter (DMT)-like permease
MDTDPQASRPPLLSARLAGLLALGLTVLVWAGFFLSLRAGAKASLPVGEIAAFRFLPAAVCFLPVLWRRWRRIAAVPWPLLLAIVCGAGLPYFLVAGKGMRLASVADGSTLVPGTLPLFVSLLALGLLGQPITSSRRKGLLIISSGVLLMLLFSLNHAAAGLWHGYALFLCGSILWASFTLALRRSGLEALEGAAVVTYGSIPLLILNLLLSSEPLQIHHLPPGVLSVQFLLEGLGVGLVSTISYAYAVARLGPDRAAIAGALTPVVSTLLAIPVLGEIPPLTSLLGMALITAGVAVANRPQPAAPANPQISGTATAPVSPARAA